MIGMASVLLRALPWTQDTKGPKTRPFSRVSGASRDPGVVRTVPRLFPIDDSEDYEKTHAFSQFSNWVIPGRLMVGRYPFIEPGRCHTREKGMKQLKMILKTGIRTFVCLQEELPEQNFMRNNGPIDGFHPYLSQCEKLAGEKITAMHFPVRDLSIPDEDALYGILMEIEDRLRKGEIIYIHCWGGRGRAGLVACCLLSKIYKISAEESLERIGRAFLTRKDGTYRSPQTRQQIGFVKEFVARYC